MHRTTDPDSVTIGSLTLQHINENLPGTPGTALSGEFANAVQEEIINVIEEAGISIETVPATDRSDGFIQLRDAIFDSEAIDTAALTDGAITDVKVTSVGIDKLIYGVMDITDGDYNMQLHNNRLIFSHETPSVTYPIETMFLYNTYLWIFTEDPDGLYTISKLTDTEFSIADTTDATYDLDQILIDKTKVEMKNQKADGSTDLETDMSITNGFLHTISGTSETVYTAQLRHSGLSFNGSGKNIKHRVISIPLSSWSGPSPGYTKSDTASSLPTTVDILSVSATVKHTATGGVFTDTGVIGIEFQDLTLNPATGFFDISVTTDIDPTSGLEDMYVTIWYAD